MLVGVGGSGKQSLTRFASFVSDTTCISIELTRNYSLTEFREDLKKLYRCGKACVGSGGCTGVGRVGEAVRVWGGEGDLRHRRRHTLGQGAVRHLLSPFGL